MYNQRKLAQVLSRPHSGFSTGKLHPHFTRINFPTKVDNKIDLLKDIGAQVLKLGQKFVSLAPEQVPQCVPREIETMSIRGLMKGDKYNKKGTTDSKKVL